MLCQGTVGGKSTTKDNGRKYLWYRCQNKAHKGKKGCLLPTLTVNIVDYQAWQAIEALLRNPEWELDLLQKAQAKQRAEHADSVQALESIERVRGKYEADLHERYLDWKEGLITKEMYKAEKERLDERLKAAEEVYREYQQRADKHILSDTEIKRIGYECRRLADLLDRLGNLEFEDKRKFVEAMDITGQYRVDEEARMLILDLFVYQIDFESVPITEMPVAQKRGRF